MVMMFSGNNTKRELDDLRERFDQGTQNMNTRVTILEERTQNMFHRIDHVDGEVVELRKDIGKVTDMVIDIRSLIQNNIIAESKVRVKMLFGGIIIVLSIIYPDIFVFIGKLM